MAPVDDDFRWWLGGLGLGQYLQAFRDNDVDFSLVQWLSDADLIAIGLSLGHRRAFQIAVNRLRPTDAESTFGEHAAAQARGERRQITVLACDLVNSTGLSNRLDPEDLRKVIFRYCIQCCRIIKESGGSDARVVGDGIQALFGYPKAREDAAECAVRAGLRIAEMMALERMDDCWKIDVRIGLATGIVVVSDMVGHGFSERRAVTGPAPNLAARLQSLTEAGTVAVADETKRLAGGFFLYADRGKQFAKGFENLVQVWRVIGESDSAARFDSKHAVFADCVGRDMHLDALAGMWESVLQDRCCIATLVGEAGIGKSRLLRAASERLVVSAQARVMLQCSPSREGTPLHPLIDWLRRELGATQQGGDVDHARMRAWLGDDAGELQQSLMVELLGLRATSGHALLLLPPDRKRDLTRDILLRHFERRCASSPTLLMIEDAQWMDGASQFLLSSLFERMRDKRLMVIITFRTESSSKDPSRDPPQPRWEAIERSSVMPMGPLPPADAELLVRNLCRGKNLPRAVVDAILAKTDGVPLFLEELTATILESGQLREEAHGWVLEGPLREFEIPTTLRDSLLERLDRLSDITEVARTGGALGREFSFSLLAHVSQQPEGRLVAALDQLVEAKLLFQRGTPPDAVYTFKHALVRDVARDSRLRGDRPELHRRIVEAIETHEPELARREPGLMADHCECGGLTDRQVDYLYAAGLASTRIVAIPEAFAHFRNADGLLSKLEQTHHNIRRNIAVILGMMEVGRFAVLPSELRSLSERARRLSQLPGIDCDDAMMSAILFQDGRAKLYSSNYAEARSVFQEIRQLGLVSQSEAIERKPASAFSMCLCCQGLFNETLEFVNDANIGYYKQSGSFIDYISGLGWIGYANCQVGFIESGLRSGDLSVREAELVQSQIYLAGAYIWRSHALMAVRRLDEAVADAQRCVTLSETHDVPYLGWHGLVFLALCQCRADDFAAASQSLTRARVLRLETVKGGQWSLLDYLPAIDAEIACFSGQPLEAERLADEAINVARSTGGHFAEALAWRVKAICRLRTGGDPDEAQAFFDRALAWYAQGNARAETAFSALVWAHALHSAGHADRACPWVVQARTIAGKHGFMLESCEHGAAAVL